MDENRDKPEKRAFTPLGILLLIGCLSLPFWPLIGWGWWGLKIWLGIEEWAR